jgi:hypothetical protein
VNAFGIAWLRATRQERGETRSPGVARSIIQQPAEELEKQLSRVEGGVRWEQPIE